VKKKVNQQFGQRIRALRLERQWTQEELASRAGFHRTYIGMLERGERNIALQNIATLAQVFGLSMSNPRL
jgi:transcriptional regulator with XRE-family HTH domain